MSDLGHNMRILTAAPIIEAMESRYPEQTIALRVLEAVQSPILGQHRLVVLADVIKALEEATEPSVDTIRETYDIPAKGNNER